MDSIQICSGMYFVDDISGLLCVVAAYYDYCDKWLCKAVEEPELIASRPINCQPGYINRYQGFSDASPRGFKCSESYLDSCIKLGRIPSATQRIEAKEQWRGNIK